MSIGVYKIINTVNNKFYIIDEQTFLEMKELLDIKEQLDKEENNDN